MPFLNTLNLKSEGPDLMDDPSPYIQRAQLLLEQNRPKEAEKQLRQVIEKTPLDDYVLSLLAKCKIDLRQFDDAAELIGRAISLKPNEDYYFYLLAFIFYQQDNNSAALLNLQQASRLNPRSAAYFGLWAMILIEEKEFAEALNKADAGLAIDPIEITCLNARSTALNKLRRTEDAAITMENALKQDPENEFTHTTIGWNLLEKGNHRSAIDHFKVALRLRPDFDSARNGFKEALKSKVPPYKWLLRYSFWITNKSKNLRWIIPVSIFIAVRLFAGASAMAGSNWKIAGIVLAVLYLLFVATSWIIHPLANFFLLFDKDGKYAITSNEKWNAITFISALITGTGFVVASLLLNRSDELTGTLLITGFVFLTLAIPLGHMRYPWTFRKDTFLQWYSQVLIVSGIVTGIAGLSGSISAQIFNMFYFVAFAIYLWVNAFSKR